MEVLLTINYEVLRDLPNSTISVRYSNGVYSVENLDIFMKYYKQSSFAGISYILAGEKYHLQRNIIIFLQTNPFSLIISLHTFDAISFLHIFLCF